MKKFYDRYWNGKQAELADFKYKWPILSSLIPRDTSIILDYGCGKGKILSEVRKLNKQAILYGADISKLAILASNKRVPSVKILEINDDQRVSLPSNSCDFILSLDVIEHIYDTEKVFIEFQRLIKRGGYLLLSTPYYGVIKNIIIAIIGFNFVYDPKSPHIRFYTKKNLITLLKEYGFSVEKFGYYGRFLYVWRGMYVLARKVSDR